MKSLWRKPDLVLALIVAEVCTPLELQSMLTAGKSAYDAHFSYWTPWVIIAYIVFESLRAARPLNGIFAGVLGATILAMFRIVDYIVFRAQPLGWTLIQALPSVAFGAAFGLVLSALAWPVHRRWEKMRGTQASASPGRTAPQDSSAWPLALSMLMAVAPLVESAMLALETWFCYAYEFWTLDHRAFLIGGKTITLYERAVMVALAGLATFGVVKRRPWARGVMVAYLSSALLFTLLLLDARLTVERWFVDRLLASHLRGAHGGAWNLTHDFPPFPAFLLWASKAEPLLRAIACAVGIPYVLISRKLKESLQLARPEV